MSFYSKVTQETMCREREPPRTYLFRGAVILRFIIKKRFSSRRNDFYWIQHEELPFYTAIDDTNSRLLTCNELFNKDVTILRCQRYGISQFFEGIHNSCGNR